MKKSGEPISMIAKAFRATEASVSSRWTILRRSMSSADRDPGRQQASPSSSRPVADRSRRT
jgi:hypothetical protein